MRRLSAAAAVAICLLGGLAPAQAEEPSVTAEGAVLWDPVDDRVLWGKNETRSLPPASTTKIMTVLLALEEGAVDDTVTVSAKAVAIGRRPGAANLNLRPGQEIPMRSLLQGLLLRSGNDAAVAVAEHISGSEDAFVEKMNARAAELGMNDTHFINSTGLTNDTDHAASALDLAKLADAALRNRDFAQWAAAEVMTVASVGVLENRNELLGSYDGANGVKTGYTALAGLCLVASAQRGDRPLIAVVLNSDDATTQGSFIDAGRVLDHGFDDFRLLRPVRPARAAATYRWHDTEVDVVAQEPLTRTVAVGRRAQLDVELAPTVDRPVEAGATLGTARLVVGRNVVDETTLVAGEAVPAAQPQPAADAAGGAVADTLRAFARSAPVSRRLPTGASSKPDT